MTAADEPIRVLHVADNPYMGGITSHILSVVEAFRDRQDFTVHAAVLTGRTNDRALFERAAAAGCPVHEIPMAWTFDARVLGRLRDFVRDGEYALVHIHNYRAAWLAALARLTMPLVYTCHGAAVAPAFRTRLWQRGALRVARGLPRVVACSQYVAAWLAAQGVPRDRIATVYNAVAAPPPAPADSDRDAPHGATVFLYAGRLAPGKGLETLLDAAAGLPNAVLRIAGDGPLRAPLEEQVRRLGLDARFLGNQADMAPIYHTADAVVLPSEMEALPMTLIEAAAWGKPAIGTTAGGIPEVIADGETGLLTPPRDVEGLRDAMMRLMDAAKRERLGDAARARWRARFSPDAMAEGLASVYRAVCARPEM